MISDSDFRSKNSFRIGGYSVIAVPIAEGLWVRSDHLPGFKVILPTDTEPTDFFRTVHSAMGAHRLRDVERRFGRRGELVDLNSVRAQKKKLFKLTTNR